LIPKPSLYHVLFGHIGVTVGLFILLEYVVHGIRGRIDYRYVILGALLPDVIDKLIGRVIFAYSLANGQIIAHTLIFGVLFFIFGFYCFSRYGNNRILPLSGAFLLHILELMLLILLLSACISKSMAKRRSWTPIRVINAASSGKFWDTGI